MQAKATKHTAGPWKHQRETDPPINGNYTIYSTVTNDCIASIPRPWINKEANANIIAAAPEMLDALRLAVRCLKTEDNPKGPYWIGALEAAIEKAEGRHA